MYTKNYVHRIFSKCLYIIETMIENFWIFLFVLLSFFFIKSKLFRGNRMERMAPEKFKAIMKKNIHYNLTTYLPLQDAFKLGITCKSLFVDMIEEEVDEAEEGKHRITKICTINIPENIFPHVTFLFTILT